MDVLAVVHGPLVRAGVFGDAVEERGHRLVEWSPLAGTPPPEDFGAALVFGGAMHVDQEEQHPWLRDEDAFLRRPARGPAPRPSRRSAGTRSS